MKIGPKSVKKFANTERNAGISDLVAKDKDKGYPPENPLVKSPLKRRLITTLSNPKSFEKGIVKVKRGGGSLVLTSREPGLDIQNLSYSEKNTPKSSQNFNFGEPGGEGV